MSLKEVVVIGGGTGSYNLLRGLKKYASDEHKQINIRAIVTMMDSGGSSGKLRDEYGILPPGDLRRCVLALSEETELMKGVFQYRFRHDSSLNGHNLGNLFFAALNGYLKKRGVSRSEEKATLELHKLLKVRGEVIPVTYDKSHLSAVLDNGETVNGETVIDLPRHNSHVRIKDVYLKPKAKAYRGALKAIREADAIVIGPGDLYTSIVVNFLVKGIPEAIRNSKALKIYNCNVMTKNGETNGFNVYDHLEALERYLGRGVIDIVTYNTKKVSEKASRRYKREHAEQVRLGHTNAPLESRLVGANLITEPNIIRHDPEKIGRVIMGIISKIEP